jgi:hypothetical protein
MSPKPTITSKSSFLYSAFGLINLKNQGTATLPSGSIHGIQTLSDGSVNEVRVPNNTELEPGQSIWLDYPRKTYGITTITKYESNDRRDYPMSGRIKKKNLGLKVL